MYDYHELRTTMSIYLGRMEYLDSGKVYQFLPGYPSVPLILNK